MAEGRMVKKEIAKSRKIAALKNEKARSLYFMIYPHVDVEGRHSADPYDIKAECVPLFNWNISSISRALEDLHEGGLIVLYKVDNKAYLEIVRFKDFQRIDINKEAVSKIPAPEHASTPHSIIHKEKIIKVMHNARVKEKGEKFEASWLGFLEMRVKIRRPTTDNAENLILDKLEKLAHNDTEKQINILNQSIMNSWQGVFPLKDGWYKNASTPKSKSGTYESTKKPIIS